MSNADVLSSALEVRSEYKNIIDGALNELKTAQVVRNVFLKEIAISYPKESLVGSDTIYTRAKWGDAKPRSGVLGEDQYTNTHGDLYLSYYDIVKGVEAKGVLEGISANVDDLEIDLAGDYLLMVFYEDTFEVLKSMDSGLQILNPPSIDEFLFIKI